MAGLFTNFELGLAGISDAIGLTTDEAASVYANQTAAAAGDTNSDDVANLTSQASAAEDSGQILAPAADMEAQQAADAVTSVFDWSQYALVFVGVVVAIVAVAVVAVESKPARTAVGV